MKEVDVRVLPGLVRFLRPRRAFWLTPFTIGTLVLLSGCVTVGPEYEEPPLAAPDAWHTDLVGGVSEGQPSLRTWWRVFEDPVLEHLIAAAEESSPDLKIAVGRVSEARALRGVAAGAYFPEAAATGDAARVGTGAERALGGESSTDWFYSNGLGATWEIDFWGRVRRSVEAADAQLAASIEDYRDVQVTLYGDVAINYLEARALQVRIRYAEANAEIQRASLQLALDRLEAELVPEIDVRQAELALASTEAAIPQLRSFLNAAVNRLAVLTGSIAEEIDMLMAGIGEVPDVPPSVLVGAPAEVLRQRPDVRRAERLLAAQTARVGVATAELYPRFSLSGTLAFEGDGDIYDAANRVWSFGPAFRWRLFEGGRIRSQIAVEDARVEQALAAYELTVLSAFEDFENAVTAYLEETRRMAALKRSVVAAGKALELVLELYRTGLTDFQNVLDMQRSATQQEDAFAESEGRVAANLVRVYRAMGGGWK